MTQRKEWKFERTYDFYIDLVLRESTGLAAGHSEEHIQTGYIGLFHMGEAALTDVGYYKKPTFYGERAPRYNNDWTGIWLGKNGVRSKEDFIADEEVQNIAVRKYHQIIWENYLRDYHKYEGQDVAGIILTKAGMLGASHLVGVSALKRFIDTNGAMDATDSLGMSCIEYLEGFSDSKYVVDYSTAALEKAHFEAHNGYEDIFPELGLGANAQIDKLLGNPVALEVMQREAMASAMEGLDKFASDFPDIGPKVKESALVTASFAKDLHKLATEGPNSAEAAGYRKDAESFVDKLCASTEAMFRSEEGKKQRAAAEGHAQDMQKMLSNMWSNPDTQSFMAAFGLPAGMANMWNGTTDDDQ